MTNGDEAETVVIGRYKTRWSTYHTRECSNYPSHPREISLQRALARGYTECSVCTQSVTRVKDQGTPLAKQLENLDPEDI